MTPRAVFAALDLAERRHRMRLAEYLGATALASQGAGKDIEREMKRLSTEP